MSRVVTVAFDGPKQRSDTSKVTVTLAHLFKPPAEPVNHITCVRWNRNMNEW